MTSNEQLIAQDLAGLGFTAGGQAGALGNLQVESGFNPAAYNPRENAHGIAQWENGRYSNGLLAYAQSHHLDVNSIQADLGYLNQELEGPYRQVLDAGRSTPNTAAGASSFAQVWQSIFEGSTVDSLPQRQANAVTIFNGGHLALTQPGLSTNPSTVAAIQPAGWHYVPGLGFVPDLPSVSHAAKDVADGIMGAVQAISHPVAQFLEDTALVVFGLLFVLAGLALLALHHASGDGTTAAVVGGGEHAGETAAVAA